MSEPPSAPPVPPGPPSASPVPPGPPPAPPATAAPVPLLRRPLVAGVAGLLVGAVLVGVPMALLGGAGGPDFGGGGGGSALQAPGAIADLRPMAEVRRAMPGASAQQTDQLTAQDRKSGQNLSAAYSGAPAVVQSYSDSDMGNIVVLDAVRAESPEPYVQFEDTAMLQEARPVNQLLKVGPVSCVLFNDFTAAGQTPGPEATHVTYCQRTGPGLTVIIRPGAGDLSHDPGKVAALVESAWSALS
ncbi:hypothetical protein LN042_21090 [Kitasatospora sp. RB6PN24]|uniref:hypothetical protein n=1 Tax=Kitasatospora humi TaxID=2893891 RepID=UPI001E3972D2|nr:hypothetical protein [Kitasatospora humi]MCC9309542.1 hypothetical protein [Kitasatospora humi]